MCNPASCHAWQHISNSFSITCAGVTFRDDAWLKRQTLSCLRSSPFLKMTESPLSPPATDWNYSTHQKWKTRNTHVCRNMNSWTHNVWSVYLNQNGNLLAVHHSAGVNNNFSTALTRVIWSNPRLVRQLSSKSGETGLCGVLFDCRRWRAKVVSTFNATPRDSLPDAA